MRAKDRQTCLSFSPKREDHIRKAIAIARTRYNFSGKSGVAMCCTDGDEHLMPKLSGSHRQGDDIADFDIPKCDFCLWLGGFAGEANQGAAEAKLAEASYQCRTMFFSSAVGRPVEETVLRHTRYEHAVEIGRAGGQNVFMCW